VKISIVQGGGIAGLVSTTVADSDSLAPKDAETLRSKVEEAGVFDLDPAATAAGDRQPDRPSYEVTVEDGARRCQIVLEEGSLPDSVRELISWVESVPGREERLSGPGGR
jgi:hypothetical protein